MSPREKEFKKQDIVNAAFEVVRKQGREKLSARTIAQVLNSSTMPIYSYMKSMKKLEREIEHKASDLLFEYQTVCRTGRPFLDTGIGYVIFAKEEKNLFKYMFMTERSSLPDQPNDNDLDTIVEIMHEDSTLEGLDREKMRAVLEKMWIFVHGLACMLSFGIFEQDSEEHIVSLIQQTGNFVIQGEIHRNEA